ncbi:hypothetical protein [Kribbella sp. CA-293567]|uniref:hypothetical protein n=1 Tax=Kribbella sp. CA-293567 TaxID=3002436 RepID=UPI0022DE734C|nr:hypothetical protein [Kribbella sp. CA-293567]WBQ08052.1 hypothetical protein OX958_14890 [Kribbella sp. CA-293567]
MTTVIIFVVFLLIFGLGRKAAKSAKADPSTASPRVRRLLEQIQAQQAGLQPPQVQGQFTQPLSGQPLPGQTFPGAPPTQVHRSGRAQSSAQLAGMLHTLLQAGQQGQSPTYGQHPQAQGQYGQGQVNQGQYGGPAAQGGYAPPGQYQPAQQYPAQQPTNWPPQYQQGPPAQHYQAPPAQQYQQTPQHAPQYAPQANRTQHGRQPEHNFPAPNSPLERRIRELMSTGNEVPAIRLLCDEQDLGIIEAQKYARELVAPPSRAGATPDLDSSRSDSPAEENRYVGSAAFAESVFDLDRDENVWASGWVEKADTDDRTDIDELWQTVRNAGRPATPAS